jgi:phage host-nuclease inhibitor protein Gam
MPNYFAGGFSANGLGMAQVAKNPPIFDAAGTLTFRFFISSREQLEAIAGEVGQMESDLESRKKSRDDFMKSLDDNLEIPKREKAIEEKRAAMHSYCLEHEAELFPEGRTLNFPGAILHFNVNPPAVNFVRGWTEKLIVAALLAWKRKGKKYLRFKAELDKVAIKADWEKFKARVWASRGIVVEQGRSLIIEPIEKAAS